MIAEPNIIDFRETRLIGSRLRMSFVADRTSKLWRGFRTIRPTIAGEIGGESYSVKVYDSSYSFSSFDPSAEFDKWAAVAVESEAGVPDGLESLIIPSGKYAEFTHVGPASEAPRTFGYIFGEWLPASEFELDLRPHFEILPEGYDPFAEDSSERALLPIRSRQS
ncbi:MAG: GyrI-like domain-containing protein [bacterium]|nr:GyrI-like domain-containing protein [bacterium]